MEIYSKFNIFNLRSFNLYSIFYASFFLAEDSSSIKISLLPSLIYLIAVLSVLAGVIADEDLRDLDLSNLADITLELGPLNITLLGK